MQCLTKGRVFRSDCNEAISNSYILLENVRREALPATIALLRALEPPLDDIWMRPMGPHERSKDSEEG